eukprot:jgi/Botrbrau1/14729/Bobra.0108s0073.1
MHTLNLFLTTRCVRFSVDRAPRVSIPSTIADALLNDVRQPELKSRQNSEPAKKGSSHKLSASLGLVVVF